MVIDQRDLFFRRFKEEIKSRSRGYRMWWHRKVKGQKEKDEKGKGHHHMRSQRNGCLDGWSHKSMGWSIIYYMMNVIAGRWGMTETLSSDTFHRTTGGRYETILTPSSYQGGNVRGLRADEVLLGWTVCWCSGCAAWTETQPCQSQACASSSGHPCTSPACRIIKNKSTKITKSTPLALYMLW